MFFSPFKLIDIHRMDDEELKKQTWSGIVAFAYKYRKAQDFAKFLNTVIPWIQVLFEDYQAKDFTRDVVTYIFSNIEKGKKTLFVQAVEKHASNDLRGETMTIAQELMEEGYQRGERTILLKLLQRKFGQISIQYQQKLEKADSAQILQWADAVLDAKLLSEVFEE